MAEHDYRGALIALADLLSAGSPTLRRTVGGAGEPIELFAFAVDETAAAETYSVLRPYPGVDQEMRPAGAMSVQCFTAGADDAAAFSRAQLVHGRLHGASRLPLRNATAGAFVFYGVTRVQSPGLVGRREGKTEYAFSFDAFFRPAA